MTPANTQHPPPWVSHVLPLGTALVFLALLARFVLRGAFDADEIEHSHLIWCVGEGILPYRDIHQIHMPLLWILFAPLLRLFPESVGTLVLFRLILSLGFASLAMTALWIQRQAAPRIPLAYPAMSLFLLLSFAMWCQFYLIRPDTGMTLGVTLGMAFAVIFPRRPRLGSLACGLSLGIAASFSPKVLPVLAVFPFLLCLPHASVSRKGRLRGLFLYVAGGAVAAVPTLLWLLWKGLLADWWFWVVDHNATMVHLDLGAFFSRAGWRLLAIAGLGVLGLLPSRDRGSGRSLESTTARRVLGAWLLAGLLVAMLDPNHLPYNWQIAVVPACIGAGLALHRILAGAGARGTWMGSAVVFPFVLIAARDACFFRLQGNFILQNELRQLVAMTREPGTTCIGMAPKHPVFCRDATEVYLVWDFLFLTLDWVRSEGKAPYRVMISQAVENIGHGDADLVLSAEQWETVRGSGLLGPEERSRLDAGLARNYRKQAVGYFHVWVKTEPEGSVPTEIPLSTGPFP